MGNFIHSVCLAIALAATDVVAARADVTSIADIHKISDTNEIVEVKGTVTGTGPWHVLLNDRTDCIVAYDTFRRSFARTGDVLRVRAKIEFNHGYRRLRIQTTEIVGHDGELAKPIHVTPSSFRNSSDLVYRAIILSGVVTAAYRDELDPEWIVFVFVTNDTDASAFVFDPDQTLSDPSAFVDAEVEILGNYYRSQLGRAHIGPHLVTFTPSSVRITKPAPDWMEGIAEIGSINAISFDRATHDGHQRKIRGTVLATWHPRAFFLRTPTDERIRIYLAAGQPLPEPGKSVTVAGFPRYSIFFPRLTNATWRPDTTPRQREGPPTDVNPRDLMTDSLSRTKMRRQYDGRLLRLSGQVVAMSRPDADENYAILNCAGENIRVDLPFSPSFALGAVIQATGICRFTETTEPGMIGPTRINGFALVARNASDILTIENPPWLTPSRACVIGTVLLAIVFAALIWNLVLQKLIARKGRELARESLAHLKAELRIDERMALAVELHDTIAQNLTGVTMQLEGVEEAYRIGSTRLGGLIAKTRHALNSCCVELRNCLWDLRNDAFDSEDISATVRKAISPHLGTATADVGLRLQRSHISDSTFHSILCIIRELVINAVKHGKAKHIEICGFRTPNALCFSVKDDGCGFDPADRPGPDKGHFGLLGIQERLGRINGTMNVISSPGCGCEFSITIES